MPAARTCVDVEGPPAYTLRLSGDAANVKPAVLDICFNRAACLITIGIRSNDRDDVIVRFPENVPSGCRVIVVVWAVLPVGTIRLSGFAESMKLA
jgi:hypothetical protein